MNVTAHETQPPNLEHAAYDAMYAIAGCAERGTDEIIAAWAALRALAEGADYQPARQLADAFEDLVALIVALQLNDGQTESTTPKFVNEALAGFHSEIERAGRVIPPTVRLPDPMALPASFAAGVKVGLQRARLLDRAGGRRRGGLRR
jgi:hypothetical protein